jgi:hypothetical protein
VFYAGVAVTALCAIVLYVASGSYVAPAVFGVLAGALFFHRATENGIMHSLGYGWNVALSMDRGRLKIASERHVYLDVAFDEILHCSLQGVNKETWRPQIHALRIGLVGGKHRTVPFVAASVVEAAFVFERFRAMLATDGRDPNIGYRGERFELASDEETAGSRGERDSSSSI